VSFEEAEGVGGCMNDECGKRGLRMISVSLVNGHSGG
jgi:hypothetical protein